MAKRVQFDHLVPVSIGGTVWAEATLDRIEGRRLVFTLSVSESAGLVAAGKLIRVVVGPEVLPGQRPLSGGPGAEQIPRPASPSGEISGRAHPVVRGSCR